MLTTKRDNKIGSSDDCAREAFRYTLVLQHFNFIITLVTTAMLIGYTQSATIQLQSSHIDVIDPDFLALEESTRV